MKNTTVSLALFSLLLPLLPAACQNLPDAPPITTRAQAIYPDDGSTSVFGERVNGRSLTGEAGPGLLAGVAYRGAYLGGQPIADVTIVGGRLLGRLPGGDVVEGLGWQGAILAAEALDGAQVPLRIDRVDLEEPNFHYYTVSRPRLDGAGGLVWGPLCKEAADGDLRAVPVAARWNQSNGDRVESADRFTFGCRSGAIGKCVRAGYRPWLGPRAGIEMADVHQACTRLIRADYCGNGHPHTLDGTGINIVDDLAPQVRAHFVDVQLYEGAWTRHGAYCLSHLRWDFLKPECDLRSEPGVPRGPFERDAAGNRLAPRACDVPAEAVAVGAPFGLFSESLPEGKDDVVLE